MDTIESQLLLAVHRCPSCHQMHPKPFYTTGGDVLLDGIPQRVCHNCWRRIRAEAREVREVLPVKVRRLEEPVEAGSIPAAGREERERSVPQRGNPTSRVDEDNAPQADCLPGNGARGELREG